MVSMDGMGAMGGRLCEVVTCCGAHDYVQIMNTSQEPIRSTIY